MSCPELAAPSEMNLAARRRGCGGGDSHTKPNKPAQPEDAERGAEKARSQPDNNSNSNSNKNSNKTQAEKDDDGDSDKPAPAGGDATPPCPICQEPVGRPTPEGVVEGWSKLPCGHRFGSHCIKRWLGMAAAEKPCCPVCRRSACHSCGHPVLPVIVTAEAEEGRGEREKEEKGAGCATTLGAGGAATVSAVPAVPSPTAAATAARSATATSTSASTPPSTPPASTRLESLSRLGRRLNPLSRGRRDDNGGDMPTTPAPTTFPGGNPWAPRPQDGGVFEQDAYTICGYCVAWRSAVMTQAALAAKLRSRRRSRIWFVVKGCCQLVWRYGRASVRSWRRRDGAVALGVPFVWVDAPPTGPGVRDEDWEWWWKEQEPRGV